MATIKSIMFTFTILISLSVALAQDGPTSPANPHDPTHDHHERFFFSLFPTVAACNYTANIKSCTSCTEALTCFSNNVGISQTCRGFFRFCNNGSCSLFRGADCDPTTSTTTSSTTAAPSDG